MELNIYRKGYGMHYIKNLPYILTIFVTLIIGALGLINGTEKKVIYIRMLFSLVVFLLIGLLSRNIISDIYKQSMLDKQKDAMLDGESEQLEQNEHNKGLTIDFKIDDKVEPGNFDEEFTPLKVSEVIRKKMKDE